MNLIEIARIYTDLIKVHDEIPDSEYVAKEEVGGLRSKYHQMLMDKMSEDGLEFVDRFDAMNRAFELIKDHNREILAKSLSESVRKLGS